ncbi:hypothetical protein [Arcobacter vandammei]|uniref:hypothetical protein n=1 Tax=Arcobacter vandammei TaxID=2782243 RepID=UPI0018DFC76E|nr:hypothetical protein [Arcobacter vandammei]
MYRGIYDFFLQDNKVYNNSNKEWMIELSTSTIIWFDLTKSFYEDIDLNSCISKYMLEHKKKVEEYLEKRFIYFIFSRKKVRFNIKKKPKYSFFSKKLNLEILIGRERKIKKIELFSDNTKPKVEITEKYITFIYNEHYKETLSIHDFLINYNIDIGEESKIHYIGYTKNPNKRPLNGNHSGLNDILYNVSNEDNDFFVSYNLFKVTSNSINNEFNIIFRVSNPMTDEVDVNTEGLIIEKCFILYFNAINQSRNKNNELSELKNTLKKLSIKNKINSIYINYELENNSEYWKFYSENVKPTDKHNFKISLNENKVCLEVL